MRAIRVPRCGSSTRNLIVVNWNIQKGQDLDWVGDLAQVQAEPDLLIRNGKRHNAENAEEHLRMKHRRGKRYVTTAETFIERLASSSSMSKKPNYVECSDDEPVPSGDWLMQRLSEFRAGR